MKRYKLILEEKLTYHRMYEVEVEKEEDLNRIVDALLEADESGRPSDYIPRDASVKPLNEYDMKSPVSVEYEYFDEVEI